MLVAHDLWFGFIFDAVRQSGPGARH